MRKRESGLLAEYKAKIKNAEERLARTGLAFLVPKDGSKLIFTAGSLDPEIYEHSNFQAIIVGDSPRVLREIYNLLVESESIVAETLSSGDFYPTVAAAVLSNYLNNVLEFMEMPVALAVSILIIDHWGKIYCIDYNGDVRIHKVEDLSRRMRVGGFHNKRVFNRVCRWWEINVDKKPNLQKYSEELKSVIGAKVVRLIQIEI